VPGRHGPLSAFRRAGPFSGRTGLRLSTSHDYEVAYSCRRARSDVAQADLLPSPPPTPPAGRTANTAPLHSTDPSFCGWRLILAPRFFRCLSSVPAPNTWPIASSIPCESAWPPFCIPLFTSDGLNRYFYALTAHFGPWLPVRRRGRNVRQWQVAAGLIYGQVKKSYRRRKLVRVTPVMRLGTEDADPRRETSDGLLRPIEHRFYRASEPDRPPRGGSARTTYLGHFEAGSTTSGPSGVVAGVLSFCASPCRALGEARAAGSREVANGRRNAIGNALRPWLPAEPPVDGRRARCSRAHCRRFPLESRRSQMGVQCHVASKSVNGQQKHSDRAHFRMRWPVRTAQ
jgi:hypothetical protein